MVTTPLQKAALAVIDKWTHSHPLKECAVLELREALDAEIAQSVEPLAWIERDMQCDDFDPDSVTCSKQEISADGWEWAPLYLHPPQPQATTAVPEGYVLVPIEPTPVMLDAMSSSGWKYASYRSMLAAAKGEK